MGKYYCIPDIHGEKELLDKALDLLYTNNPRGGKIIFLGDYIDRGPDSLGVIQTIMNPPENWEFIPIMGNHEDMYLGALHGENDFYDGDAARQISGLLPEKRYTHDVIATTAPTDIVQWMKSLPIFHIENSNIFAHAAYDDQKPETDQNPSQVMWSRYADSEPFYSDTGRFLTHGHTPRRNGPIFAQNRLNLDCGAPFYGQLAIATYTDEHEGPVNLDMIYK